MARLEKLAARLGVVTVGKKAAEVPEHEDKKPVRKRSAPREDQRLAKLKTLPAQDLFAAIVKKSKGFNVTEANLERLLADHEGAPDVETIHANLEHNTAKQVVAAFLKVLNATKPDWESKGVLLNTEKSVFLVLKKPAEIIDSLAERLYMIERMEMQRKDKDEDVEAEEE